MVVVAALISVYVLHKAMRLGTSISSNDSTINANTLFALDFQKAAEKPRFHNMSLHRLSYNADGMVDKYSFDPRLPVEERFFQCNKKVLIIGESGDKEVHDPVTTLYKELSRLSSCTVKVADRFVKTSQATLLAGLKGHDVVLWWDWKCDIEALKKVRKDLPEQVWIPIVCLSLY